MLFKSPRHTGGNAAAVKSFKSADEHLAGLTEFFGFSPTAPQQFQTVQGAAFRTNAFDGDPVAQFKEIFIEIIDTLACLAFHG